MKNKTLFIVLSLSLTIFLTFTQFFPKSCEKEPNYGGIPRIDRVRPLDPTQKDESITSAFPGDVVVIVGENLWSTRMIKINGRTTFFSPTMVTNNHLIFTIDPNTPSIANDPNVGNQLVLYSDEGQMMIPFRILPPPPSVNNVNKTSARVGEQLTFFGTNLFYVTDVEFPGEISSKNYIVFPDGKSLKVVIPEGVKSAGKITIKTESGRFTPDMVFSFKPRS
jgi:hypothetical protein